MTILRSSTDRISVESVFSRPHFRPVRVVTTQSGGWKKSHRSRRDRRTGARMRQLMFGAVVTLGVGLAACGGGGGGGGASIDFVPVATKVQVSTNGFSFPNFPSNAYKLEFSTEDVIDMFGSGPAVCVDGKAEGCVLTAEAAAFARMVNQSRASGHCEGLAVVALNRFDTSADPPTVKLPAQEETIRAIMRAFATQFIPEAQQEIEGWLGKSLEDKLAALIESFKAGKLSYTLGVYIDSGGHTVMPYAVEFPTKETARIMVYDTNWPGKNRYVDVDLKAKTWRFSFSGEDPANDPNEWSGGPADMDLTSFESRSGSCPFCGDGTKTNATTMLIRTTNLDWSVEADGQVLAPGTDPAAGSGVIVKPVKGGLFPDTGFVGMRDKRATYDYMIRIPNKPAKPGQPKKKASKLKFSGTTSLFAVTPTGIAQVNTPGNPNIPVEVSDTSIVSKDPGVQLTLASGNLVATASGPSASLEASASGTMEVKVTAANGQVVTQEVTPEAPAAKVVADSSGGVVALVATTTGEVVKREVSSTGVETKTTSTESLDLNATTFKAPAGLESKPIEALPALDKRNLANPEYKADAPYVAPTTTTTAAVVKAKAVEQTKTVVSKFVIDPVEYGAASFSITEPISNSSAPFKYASSDLTVATVNATTGRVTIVGAGTTMITATQEATANYTASTITTYFKVEKATPKLGTFTVPKKTFGDAAFTVTAPTSTNTAPFAFDSSNEAVAKINATTGRVTIVGAGSTTITASQSSSTDYEPVERKAVLTVAKAPLVFSMSNPSDVTYGAGDFVIASPTTPSSGAITYTSANPDVATVDANSGRVRVVGTGNASIRISQAASSNYEAATQTVTFSVRKATPRLGVFAVESKAFGSADFNVIAPSSTSAAAFSYTSSNPSVATVTSSGAVSIVSAGTTTITATQSSNSLYEGASAAATFTVTQGTPTLSVTNPTDKPYGAADFTLSAPVTNSSGAITYTSLTPSVATVHATTGLVHLVGTGTVNIQVSVAATTNHVAATKTITFVALKAMPSYGAFSMSSIVSTAMVSPMTPPSSTSPAPFRYSSSNPAVATIDASTGQITVVSAGSTIITVSQDATSNFEASSTSATLTITRDIPVLGSFSVPQLVYGGSTAQITAPSSTSPGTFSYSSSDTNVVSVTSSGVLTPVGAGTAVITATQAQTPLYSSEYTIATAVVSKAMPIYGSFSIQSRVIGAAAFTVTNPSSTSPAPFTYSSSDTSVATISSTGEIAVIGTGTTTITLSQDATANYAASSTSATFAVNKPSPTFGPFSTLNSNPADGLIGTRYVGYFWDDPDWFNTATPHGETNAMTDFTYFSSNADVYSWEWKGTFKSGVSGSYQFCTNSDDASFIWLGDTATSGATSTNALVQNPGIHGTVQRCGTITLAAATSYPFRMVFGDNCCGDSIEMWFSINGGARIYNGLGYYYSSQDPRVGDANFTLAVPTSTSSGAMTFTSSDPGVASINSLTGEVTIVSAGTTTISVNQAEDGTYAAGSTSATMTVGKGKQAALDVMPTTCALGGACQVGDTGPGGGTVIYAPQAAFTSGASCGTNCRYIEIAPETWNGGTTDADNQLEWGCSGTSITGTATTVGSGFANTAAIADGCATGVNAARAARSSNFGKKTDWYLPSKDEANIAYQQRAIIPGYLTTNTYWTSSQTSTTNAYSQGNPGIAESGKSTVHYVRPIRAFKSEKVSLAFRPKVIPLVASGGSGTGQYSIILDSVGSAQCSLVNNTITAQATGSCTIKIRRAGDANYLEATTAAINLSFYGEPITEVTVGYYSSCSISTTGNAGCWGYGGWGLLGDGTGQSRSEPVTVSGLSTGASTLAMGQHHSCAVTNVGGLKCWGHGANGQLGVNNTNEYISPVDVLGLNAQVVQVVAGHQHTCALTAAGGVKCWGWNGYGQLGDGTTTNRFLPVDVIGLTYGVKQISANFAHTCALLDNGSVKCWGINEHGQLGRGNNANSALPANVSGLTSGIASISSGRYGNCVVTINGAAKCWGHGGWGDLGQGSNASSNVPVDVLGLSSGVARTTNGEGHACAQMVSGAMKCWGRNEQGQLGVGNTTNYNTPQNVVGLSANVSSISAGMFQHTCAVVNGGTAKCWGYNGWGQLGDGTTTNRLVPTDVARADGGQRITSTLGALSLPSGTFTTQSPSFTLAAPTASRDGAITFMSSNTSVATVNAVTGQVTIVGAGRTTLAASQGGTGTYGAAKSAVNLDVRPIDATNSLTDCQMALSCNIGDIGPGGGRIFAVDTNDIYVGIDYFEAAPQDVSSEWCNATSANTWMAANDPDFGPRNMQTIMTTCNSGAAYQANQYSNNSLNDWYLPSRTEMMNLATNVGATVGTVNAPFDSLSSNQSYWTSTEASSNQAVAVSSTGASFAAYSKTATYPIRPVRAFASIYSSPVSTALAGFSVPAAQVEYLQAPFTVNRPTSLSNGLITYTSSDTTVASIHPHSGVVTVNGIGSVTFTATQKKLGGWPTSSQTANLTVIRSTPTLTGLAISSGSYRAGDPTFQVTAPTSQSPGAITYASSNTTVATVDSSTGVVTPLSAGSAEITATQALSGPWNQTTQTVHVQIGKSCADGGQCRVGDIGPGGGIVFYAAASNQTWGRFLEAATSDISGFHTWCDNASTDVASAVGVALGDGAANTAAIDAACTSSAANAASALVSGGKSDWFLPSSGELNEMYAKRATIGGFSAEPYWSSTQSAVGSAHRIDFFDGSSVAGTTVASWRIRAIRAFEGIADGMTAATAGISANQLMIDNGYTGSGNYWIKPQGYSGAAVKLWCDFSQAGGGWTLIGKGRHSNNLTGGWFGTESEVDVNGLLSENASSAGVSKVSSEFVNYLMNGTANGWTNSNASNSLVVNRINNATDGYTDTNNTFRLYGGIGDSFAMKVTTDTTFKWIDQFGSTGQNRQPQMANGSLKRYSGTWLTGSLTNNNSNVRLIDNFDNDQRRLFTWQWDGHQGNHGWSAGQTIGAGTGFLAGNEGHALQFVQLWAR